MSNNHISILATICRVSREVAEADEDPGSTESRERCRRSITSLAGLFDEPCLSRLQAMYPEDRSGDKPIMTRVSDSLWALALAGWSRGEQRGHMMSEATLELRDLREVVLGELPSDVLNSDVLCLLEEIREQKEGAK